MTALPAARSPAESACAEVTDIVIVRADEALVVLRKPPGLLSVPGRGAGRADCVAARVQARFPDALTVHRLDMSTSGLMVFARGLSAQRALGRAFETRQVHKRYVAVVAGQLEADQGSVALPLICDWPNRPRQKVDPDHGKAALTHWRVMLRAPTGATCRVELQPVTGRSHQLRVHLSALGHPILGDELYAPPPVVALAPRLLLHASQLGFAHPLGGDWLQFEDAPAF